MALPKGTFKGLAVVVGPLLLWMSAGWAAYPVLMERVVSAMGETMDVAEARLFSYVMVAVCLAAGIFLTVYGFTGRRPTALPGPADASILKCPDCGSPLPAGSPVHCPVCGRLAR